MQQRPINIIDPKLPAAAMKTYAVIANPQTHFRAGTCEEAGCLAFRHGWATAVDQRTELGQRQAAYIRTRSGRAFTEDVDALGRVTFTFLPGQPCFTEHRVRLEREPLYVVRGGDFRGNPRGTRPRVHTSAASFVDDFASHQQGLADRLERG
ncbi:hypothetical protein [Jiangella alkaliphila]|uniref:Uncharacterized protein n=1 Tax=Jiangella alkaliphila TaxID=419479 RepID=A0A1H2IFM8_9ACTN|nr:hypothetical protein [Jiangella alkaliphila]SDU42668.1 hypothetical protein SAMN04488563_1663 [Jiangella alkaliphila]